MSQGKLSPIWRSRFLTITVFCKGNGAPRREWLTLADGLAGCSVVRHGRVQLFPKNSPGAAGCFAEFTSCNFFFYRRACDTIAGTGVQGDGSVLDLPQGATITPEGDLLELSVPRDVVMDENGVYVIAETSNHRIVRCA